VTDLDAVAEALKRHDRFVVVTHENPDGDALGSMLGLTLGLRSLGKDVVNYLSGDGPLPGEYAFLGLAELPRTLADDLAGRLVVAVDCASERRIGPDTAWLASAEGVLNIDHHHDNSRFATVNLVVGDASSTAEIVRDVLAALDVPLSPSIAEALYVGLVTDTGRFQYANTTPKSLRLAAELVENGADVHGVFRHVYETVQFAKLKLLARALDHAQLYEGGRVVISYLEKEDFAAVGAEEPYSEGIIDYLRSVEGSEMVALIRESPMRGDGPTRRISLRSSHDEIDVSAIARRCGGGGHRQAAGFASEQPVEEIADFIRGAFVEATSGEAADAAAGA
jgi:bifunctional oligoribonuclease and PAP phosphatase NrnA